MHKDTLTRASALAPVWTQGKKGGEAQPAHERGGWVVETWYVGSLLEERERLLRRRGSSRGVAGPGPGPAAAGASPTGGVGGDSPSPPASPRRRPGSPLRGARGSSDAAADSDGDARTGCTPPGEDDEDDDLFDDEDEDEDEEEGSKEEGPGGPSSPTAGADSAVDGKGGKSVQDRIRRRLRQGARKIEGRVGYTPVYYDPPLRADGTLARSCLKGRAGKRLLKNGLIFATEVPKPFFYPPEEGSASDEEME